MAKLLETGLVNLDRVEVFWRPLTSHLLDACQHPHLRMREWGAEAVTTLTRAALQHTYPTPLKDNQVCTAWWDNWERRSRWLPTKLFEQSAGG